MTIDIVQNKNKCSKSNYIAQTEKIILECHYLAADLIELASIVPFIEQKQVLLLSSAMTGWADENTLIIEDIRRFIDDRASS
jgi:hypothetical protein